MEKIRKRWACFYTKYSFWAENKIEFDNNPENISDYESLITKPIFIYKNDDYSLFVCQDGLIMLRVEKIENNIKQFKDKSEENLIEYLNYLNIINFLFDCELVKHNLIGINELNYLTQDDVFSIFYKDGYFAGCSCPMSSYANK
ncbi:MAG: hypothetical protein M1419_00920, partial [Bacteroidetes bacterium]|nr:hypothetical protein [Bacteroidota bacterium]